MSILFFSLPSSRLVLSSCAFSLLSPHDGLPRPQAPNFGLGWEGVFWNQDEGDSLSGSELIQFGLFFIFFFLSCFDCCPSQ